MIDSQLTDMTADWKWSTAEWPGKYQLKQLLLRIYSTPSYSVASGKWMAMPRSRYYIHSLSSIYFPLIPAFSWNIHPCTFVPFVKNARDRERGERLTVKGRGYTACLGLRRSFWPWEHEGKIIIKAPSFASDSFFFFFTVRHCWQDKKCVWSFTSRLNDWLAGPTVVYVRMCTYHCYIGRFLFKFKTVKARSGSNNSSRINCLLAEWKLGNADLSPS